jgi:tetratricopeptide (TPR) repeat protein
MRLVRVRPLALLLPLLAACAAQHVDRSGTLASLHEVRPDTSEVPVEQGLDRAVQSYGDFLKQAPDSTLAPEAMRRLADLKIEKEFGLQGDGKVVELPASPSGAQSKPGAAAQGRAQAEPVAKPGRDQAAALRAPAVTKVDSRAAARSRPEPAGAEPATVSERDLELRASFQPVIAPAGTAAQSALPGGIDGDPARAGPLEAIKLYDELLAKYPHYASRDQVLYQKARAYDELGQPEEAMKVMEQLVSDDPRSRFTDELQFRRAERLFVLKKYRDAERAYAAIVEGGSGSEYFELALYKLGWTLYKQQLYEEALHRYFALLDYKVKGGYDFDAKHSEPEQRRIEDTFQVVSLSFSNLGGLEVIGPYFAASGHRAYEDRVYRHIAEFHFAKLRYQDAATVYRSFVMLYPSHPASPHFSMRVIEIYEKGGFPQLVLAAKKDFAATYGLQGEYWQHFDVDKSPEVLGYLKSNLTDLANHYHAQYQDPKQHDQQAANYAEATRWYRAFLTSFHTDPQAPQTHYQLADLVLENHDYAAAAHEYEVTAYDYPSHAKSAAAGYAAIYAHRENLKVASADMKDAARRDTISSSIRFADAFPVHENAAVVLAAAAEDAYEMKDLVLARDSGRHLIEKFTNAEASVRRNAWLVVAHSTFGLSEYADAEQAYGQALAATADGEASRAELVENLAASIYKQGERANEASDYRTAANHFMRVTQVAPTSKICAAAEYDAGADLLRLKDWTAAAQILEEFRRSFPEHELQAEATKQIAYAYQQAGQLGQSAGEYERVAKESPSPELRAEALLQSADLYGQAGNTDRALQAYSRYVEQFPKPVETAVETRSKIAEIYRSNGDQPQYYHQLEEIVRADGAAGSERSDRTRNVAARAALELSRPVYEQYASLKLTQPFERSLKQKQLGMDAATKAFARLLDYQVGEVTAAATFYMAEIYATFGQALRESERPADLGADALKDYEQQLADSAHPLENKAIGIHEKNLELIRRALGNAWTQKSLDRLAELRPYTYARAEISSGFVGSLDRYVYHPPPSAVESVSGNPTAPGTQPEASPASAAAQSAASSEGAPAAAAVQAKSASGPAVITGAHNENAR